MLKPSQLQPFSSLIFGSSSRYDIRGLLVVNYEIKGLTSVFIFS